MRAFHTASVARAVLCPLVLLAAVPVALAETDPSSGSATGLTAVYEHALESAPTVDEKRALERAARAGIDEAEGRRLPEVKADATYTESEYETGTTRVDPQNPLQRERVIETTEEESYRYGLNLTQPLYNKQITTALDEARSRATLAESETRATKGRLAGQVAEAYLRILRARETLRLAEAEREAYRLRVEQLENRLDRGLASRVDVLDARVRVDEARTEGLRAQNELELARLDLERLAGVRISRLRGASPETAVLSQPPSPAEVDQLQRAAGIENPEVSVAIAERDVASRTVASRQAAYHPQLTFQARYSDTNATDQLVQGEDQRIYLSLDVPLYSGGQRAAGVAEARARKQAARSRVLERRRQAVIETRRLANDLRNAYQRVDTARQSLATAEEQLNATERGLQAGIRDRVEVFDSRARLFGIRRDLSEATYDYLISQVRLNTTTGDFDMAALQKLDERYLDQTIEIATNRQ